MITGLFWYVFIFSILFVFLVLLVYRILAIIRMPVHLRWELAPIPYKKEKKESGSSYPEKYVTSDKKHPKSLVSIIVFMAEEIFLFKGVWRNNRTLWPFSIAMHYGIYLVILSMVLHFVNAMLIIAAAPVNVLDVLRAITSVIALVGYIVGTLGAVGLILKRILDAGLRDFGSFNVYFRLAFLAAIFISGVFAWFYAGDFALTMSVFTRDLFALNSVITANASLAVHLIISFLFVLYLPFTDMVHFITKYFLYHAVRWNDEPINKKMAAGLNELKTQTSTWSAAYTSPGKTWSQIATEKQTDEKASKT
jgi:nitrate reductase gamma subunit